MAGQNTYLESDGKAVNVTPLYAASKDQVVYVDGWLGILQEDATSARSVALDIDWREYQFTVPSGLAVVKGATVWVDVTVLTGIIPQDAAYFTAAGSNRIRLFKATSAKDSNNVVTGILQTKVHAS